MIKESDFRMIQNAVVDALDCQNEKDDGFNAGRVSGLKTAVSFLEDSMSSEQYKSLSALLGIRD